MNAVATRLVTLGSVAVLVGAMSAIPAATAQEHELACGPISGVLTTPEGVASVLPAEVNGQPILYVAVAPDDVNEDDWWFSERVAQTVGIDATLPREQVLGSLQGDDTFLVRAMRYPGSCGQALLYGAADRLDGAYVDWTATPAPLPYSVARLGALDTVRFAQQSSDAVQYGASLGEVLILVRGAPDLVEAYLGSVELPDPRATPAPSATPRPVPAYGEPGWRQLSPAPLPRTGAVAVVLPDDRVLMVGGDDGNGPTADVQVLDPTTGEWRLVSAMRTPRALHAATVLPSGDVLVAGGVSAYQDVPALSSAELFDAAREAWTTVAPMSEGRALLTLTTLGDGSVLALGGYGPDGMNPTISERYRPGDSSWTSLPGIGRYGHSAALTASGDVAYGGGYATDSSIGIGIFRPYDGTYDWVVDDDSNTYGSRLHFPSDTDAVLAVGCSDPAVRRFVRDTAEWTEVGGGFCSAVPGALTQNGRLLMLGGDPFGRRSCVMEYTGGCTDIDPTWVRHPNGLTVTLGDGRIVVIGGRWHGTDHGDTEVLTLP